MVKKYVQLDKLNRDELHRYLGYKNTPDDMVRGIIDECEEKLIQTVNPVFLWDTFQVEAVYDADNYVGMGFKGTELVLKGESIRKHLEGCAEAVLLVATLSADADKLIRQTEVKDMAKALIMDTAASVAIEQVCDQAEQDIKASYQNCYMTYRFGVGYGDLPLDHEQMILDILHAGKHIGLYSNDSNILTPRKSVVCVIGLSKEPLPKGQKGCATCNMVGTCAYRKQGLSCSY